jgi:hypothetical protein
MRTTLFAALALAGATLAVAPREARAEDAARAEVLATAALDRGRQGDLRVAIDLYEEAYAASPRPDYLRQIGALYDTLAAAGDSRDVRLAILYLERALAGTPAGPERTAIDERLQRLRVWKSQMRAEPQLALLTGPTPVHLLAYDSKDKYDVRLGPQSCTTPCTIHALPGPTRLTATGDVDLHLVVPPRPSQVRLQAPDSRRFYTGAALLPTGIVMGAGLWALSLACNGNDSGCIVANLVIWPVSGFALTLAGIVLLATGKTTPPPDANRFEIVGGKSPVRITGLDLAPKPGGGAGTVALEF